MIPFVAQFDMIKGYSLLYPTNTELCGLEYQALPSGLHQSSFDIIRFLHNEQFAIAIYRQNGFDSNIDSSDRSLIKMYSVGLLLNNESEELNDNIYKLLNSFDKELLNFIKEKQNNQELQSKLIEDIVQIFERNQLVEDIEQIKPSMVETFIETGPLIYNLFRAIITNKKILIKNEFNKEDFLTNENLINTNTKLIEILTNLIKKNKEISLNLEKVSKPIYNITLKELTSLKKLPGGFIGCSSDDIIFTKTSLFDFILEKHPATNRYVLYKNENNQLKEIKFYKNDLNNFIKLQTGMNFQLFKTLFNDWKFQIDNSWSSIFSEWVFGIPRSLSNINNNNNELTDSKIKSHFDTILSHYYKTFNDMIINNDEEFSFYNNNDSNDSDVQEFFSNENNSDEDENISQISVDENGNPMIDMTLSDIHQLYLNPLSNDDKEFVKNFAEFQFNRRILIKSYLDLLRLNLFSCC